MRPLRMPGGAREQRPLCMGELLLAATLFAHESAAFDVHVSAGLGGDLLLPGLAGEVGGVLCGGVCDRPGPVPLQRPAGADMGRRELAGQSADAAPCALGWRGADSESQPRAGRLPDAAAVRAVRAFLQRCRDGFPRQRVCDAVVRRPRPVSAGASDRVRTTSPPGRSTTLRARPAVHVIECLWIAGASVTPASPARTPTCPRSWSPSASPNGWRRHRCVKDRPGPRERV
jgi:hypothetical protein